MSGLLLIDALAEARIEEALATLIGKLEDDAERRRALAKLAFIQARLEARKR